MPGGLAGVALGQVSLRACLADDCQHIAIAKEGETLGELHPLGGATDLFAEGAFDAGGRQVACLGV
jgi:hypothetical protein